MQSEPTFGGTARRRRTLGTAAAVLGAMALSSCTLFSTEVKNPNAVTEDAISTQAAAAGSLVTGLYGAVNAAGNQLTGTSGAATALAEPATTSAGGGDPGVRSDAYWPSRRGHHPTAALLFQRGLPAPTTPAPHSGAGGT